MTPEGDPLASSVPALPGDDPTLVVDPGADAPALSAAELRRRLGLPEGDAIEDYGELSTIGVGGMGAVFAGREPGLMREVALKMLRPAFRWVPERIGAFIREARTTAQISHPNIVPVHRIGVFEGAGVYFSMKRVRGQTLRSIIGKLADGDAAMRRRYCMLIAPEIAKMHRHGFFHKALHPRNILYRGDTPESMEIFFIDVARCKTRFQWTMKWFLLFDLYTPLRDLVLPADEARAFLKAYLDNSPNCPFTLTELEQRLTCYRRHGKAFDVVNGAPAK